MSKIVLALLILEEISNCESRSRGAPTTACRSLIPAHGYPAQRTHPPYQIIADPQKIYDNTTVTVTIRVVSKKYRFKGFIAQAKETAYWQRHFQPAIGTFKFTAGTRRLNCYHGEHNTITHSHAQYSEDVILTWMPPFKFRGRITFMGTIVGTFKKFWTRVYSNTVDIQDYPI
ncbi:unnamed protein product [Allacma fusca]|uniref:Reelin domain-containing protein n=1 Tax=Allacma fusca TaxID=39272 RepID=A0A8J2J9G9_9HEXA|nr:unnamed protein product [Allacma fusca]